MHDRFIGTVITFIIGGFIGVEFGWVVGVGFIYLLLLLIDIRYELERKNTP